jgi:hypothetical protein
MFGRFLPVSLPSFPFAAFRALERGERPELVLDFSEARFRDRADDLFG